MSPSSACCAACAAARPRGLAHQADLRSLCAHSLEFWEPFKKLLNRMHSTDPEVVELNDQRLQQAFNDAYIVNSIVAYLRLVTSAYLKVSRGTNVCNA